MHEINIHIHIYIYIYIERNNTILIVRQKKVMLFYLLDFVRRNKR